MACVVVAVQVAVHAAAAAPRPPFAPLWTGSVDPARPCVASEYARISGRRPIDRASAWVHLAQRCTITWTDYATPARLDVAGLHAYAHFGGALLAAGFPHDCRRLLAPLVSPHAGLPQIVDSQALDDATAQVADELLALDARCDRANERRLSGFRPATCGGGTATCFDVDGSRVLERGPTPHVFVATTGPLADPEFSCELTSIATLVRRGTRYVRVSSAGIARICGGGTAAKVLDAIYRVRGSRLVLESDDSVGVN